MDARDYDMYDEWAIDFIHDYNLAHGNHDVYEEGDGFTVIIEAPQGTTLAILFEGNELANVGESKERFVRLMEEKIRDQVFRFDVDVAFNNNWNTNKNYTATELLEALTEDNNFFQDVVYRFER